ncbi:hypothetical protein BKA67DRAFT_662678 [Truncatella angustata]|uniref:Tyrosinase copper-binding domain-containing protein n=1 Tax=Truncatella angustata TaxID=152316 RepID=A0A9P8RKW4_9PEZI|nr:uncharacterized protein BKA67DRAFT_662678 [Truncatella angustata]KAH6647935.1 hypothetical protein BKA67DRAFT_662678 [Truncatella angustata]
MRREWRQMSCVEKRQFIQAVKFWDWTKDSDTLAYSPLLNELPGFGSDGNPQADFANGTHGGYCVTDGNFANHMAAIDYIDTSRVTPSSHCVSRRFDPEDPEGRHSGALITRSTISDIIALPDFASFSDAMLNETTGPAVVVPNWMQGDMAQYTAPNDVLYFLHLTQVGRLWWVWQHQVTALRLNDYTGRRRND